MGNKAIEIGQLLASRLQSITKCKCWRRLTQSGSQWLLMISILALEPPPRWASKTTVPVQLTKNSRANFHHFQSTWSKPKTRWDQFFLWIGRRRVQQRPGEVLPQHTHKSKGADKTQASKTTYRRIEEKLHHVGQRSCYYQGYLSDS